mgnify:CR=1 FL=1
MFSRKRLATTEGRIADSVNIKVDGHWHSAVRGYHVDALLNTPARGDKH